MEFPEDGNGKLRAQYEGAAEPSKTTFRRQAMESARVAVTPLLRPETFQHYARLHTRAMVAEIQRWRGWLLAVDSHHYPVTLTHLDYNARGIARRLEYRE